MIADNPGDPARSDVLVDPPTGPARRLGLGWSVPIVVDGRPRRSAHLVAPGAPGTADLAGAPAAGTRRRAARSLHAWAWLSVDVARFHGPDRGALGSR